METNIDDMNPEYYQHIIEKLLGKGTLDVYLTPIHMKKNRPAVKLNVIIKGGVADILQNSLDIIFRESTSLGIRIFENVSRLSLDREIGRVQTPWGEVRVKVANMDGEIVNAAPEYEDCRQIANRHDLPLVEVYNHIKKKYPLNNI